MKTLFLGLMLLGMAFNACAEDKLFLYEDYYAGMSPEEFFKTGPADCDKYPDDEMVCNRKQIEFAALDWTQFFEFKNNGLTCVAFGNPISMTALDAVLAWLMEEGYMPINMGTGQEDFSFSGLFDKKNKDKFEKDIDHFKRKLPYADRFTAYLIKKSYFDEIKTTDKLPENAVLVSFGASKSQGNMFVIFEAAKDAKLSR